MHRLLLASVLLPGTALAYESEPQDLTFFDLYDVFEAVEYDTGYLPSGSPLAARFYIASGGGTLTEMDATSELTWPDALTHGFTGVAGTGWFALITDIDLVAEVELDLWGYGGTWEVWSETLEMEAEAFFDPLLLAGAPTEEVSVYSEGEGTDPYEYEVDVFTGVSLKFVVEAWPRAEAALSGNRIETNDTVIDEEYGTAAHEVPEDPYEIVMSSTYVADIAAALSVILNPSMEVCVTFVGCYEVASFEVPVALAEVDGERSFDPVTYVHPLPSLLATVTSHDFGDVELGNLSNFELALENVGSMDLEGWLSIDGGEGITVFPEYFHATPGNTDGVVVTFGPEVSGETSAFLVIESNDPLRPEVRIPIGGTGFLEGKDGDDGVEGERIGGRLATCGCAAAPTGGMIPLWGLLAGLLAVRRRRG